MSEKRTILLMDDEIDFQQIAKSALQARGYAVETATDGLEGLERLKTITPHLIVLDLTMPKMGGLVFYSKICDSKGQPKYPILIVSARAEMEKLFQDFIIDGFMLKPFQKNELLDKVDAIVNKRFGAVKTIKVSGEERRAKVCIVEDDPEELKNMSEAFLACGYLVSSASNGAGAMEHIYEALPDVALIKLALPDTAGDSVIMQLKAMARTKNVQFVLYMHQSTQRTLIVDKISQKAGIDSFIEYLEPQQLVVAADELLKQYAAVG
jgi:DNA-binding response OmpR family regulator